jgi:hypothetical protein
VTTVHVAEALRELIAEVEALEDVECEECAQRETVSEEWWWQDAYERLCEKLADFKRGIATIDEVFEEADV